MQAKLEHSRNIGQALKLRDLPAEFANEGALVPQSDMHSADLKPGVVPARCSPEGLLLIGAPPQGFGTYVLPGNNYHVFDYALFWANIRADAAARLKAFGAR